MSIALLTRLPAAEAARWRGLLEEALGEAIPAKPDPATVDIALVANPPAGSFEALPNLKFIQSLWAGVDSLLADASRPRNVPLARLIDPAMADTMAEAVAAYVLDLHRQGPLYRQQQAKRVWKQHLQPRPAERRIGILGMGAMGQRSAEVLRALGFTVSGWSRTGATVEGVTMQAGDDGLEALLTDTDILVNLLPLTKETRGLLDRLLFGQLPRGASVINFARGGHLVAADLLAALDDGHLDHAVLDVFETEPLPADDPLWRHAKVTLLPHVAASTDPRTAAAFVAANVRAWRAGEPVKGLVAAERGY